MVTPHLLSSAIMHPLLSLSPKGHCALNEYHSKLWIDPCINYLQVLVTHSEQSASI